MKFFPCLAVIVGWDEKARGPAWWFQRVHKGNEVRNLANNLKILCFSSTLALGRPPPLPGAHRQPRPARPPAGLRGGGEHPAAGRAERHAPAHGQVL